MRPAPGAGRRARAAIESARSNSRRVVNGCITVGVCVTINTSYLVLSFKNAIKLARSSGFLRPAKTIFVPGMYFFGFNR